MGDAARIEVEKLISFGNDLNNLLERNEDINDLKQCLHQFQALQSQCDADFEQVECSVQEYQKKLDLSRKRTAEAKLELDVYEDTESEAKELEEASQIERMLKEELR
ncbi:OLC1v1025722C1 [Oldenlandia corymbosa var. corymbosa]|uniref:OLC1v1025722C1 n=1 Tax=Oldenlandia corymbosa var. corymbosa TaxID=529605 RepID=A0AAV1C5E6_OLDCO|nr:OLC1v1025722C1 [Oldenlandia corymbosa var. corymbosa]